jgi:putative transposase
MIESLFLLLSLMRATMRDREALVAENLLLRHQLAVLTRPTRKRPRLRARDKLFWVVVRALRRDWRRQLVLVRPESVIRWHRQAWRLLWRWRSRGPIGRPRLSAEVRELIVTMARDNPRWGSERIRGELLKLGLVVSKRSIQRYRRRGPAHPSSQTWRTFLANHAHHLWAADLLTVQHSPSRRCMCWCSSPMAAGNSCT